jgi:glycosyltransferase involved in cell wall biosynthesis
MRKQPIVSVIIPCYNYGKYLWRAVKSALDQTYTNIEVIIVNDCSTDDTYKIMEDFTDPRVVKITQTTNVGQCRNRNTGIKESKGELISLLDADDWWHEKYLETAVPAFKDSEVGAAYTFRQGWANGNMVDMNGQRKIDGGDVVNDLFMINFIGTPVTFRKCAIPDGYDENMCKEYKNLGADWWILLKLSVNWRIIGFENKYYNYNHHPESLSSNLCMRIPADRMIQNKFIKEYPGLLSEKVIEEAMFWRSIREGLYYRVLGRKALACLSYLKSILYKPFSTIPYKSIAYTIIKGK